MSPAESVSMAGALADGHLPPVGAVAGFEVRLSPHTLNVVDHGGESSVCVCLAACAG